MSKIISNPDQFKALEQNNNSNSFIMLNLLKFKGSEGKRLYAKYVKESAIFVEKAGAEVFYLGKPIEMLNGSEEWDMIMLVKYPSRKAFIEMTGNSEYLKIHNYREDAVERAVLYTTDEMNFRDILK